MRRCIRYRDAILVRLYQLLDSVVESEALGLRVPLADVYRRTTLRPPGTEVG